VGFDGENANFENVASGVFEQSGILELANDVFVNVARFVRGQEFGFDLFAIDLHAELVEVRSFGNGKNESAFEAGGVGVIEFLVNGGNGDLVVNACMDGHGGNFQRSEDVGGGSGMDRGGRPWRHGPRRNRSGYPVCLVNDYESGGEGG